MWNLLNKYPLMDPGVNSGASGDAVNKSGASKVNEATVEKQDVQVSGNGNVGLGFNANHILQFPKQPKRDDGKWVALGSLLGALLGKIASTSVMKQVKSAENKWKEVNDALFDKGKELWGKAPGEWDKMLDAETDVDDSTDWNKGLRDDELDYAYKLNDCNDAIHEKLCAYILCGYKPDYYGIATRTIAAAEAATAKECREITKTLNRYAVDKCCDIAVKLATAKVMAVVGTVSKLREEERIKQWTTNEELLSKGADTFEKHRSDRLTRASAYDKEFSSNARWAYEKRNYNYYKLTELGGEFLAAAGKNYGWLADSLRKTAEKDAAGLSSLSAMIAMVIGMWFCNDLGNMCKDDSCGGG